MGLYAITKKTNGSIEEVRKGADAATALAQFAEVPDYDINDYEAHDAIGLDLSLPWKWSGSAWVIRLNKYKNRKNKEIDQRTKDLVKGGFAHDFSTFSLSNEAQLNWLGLKAMADTEVYPIYIVDKNDFPYTIVDAAAAHAVANAAYDTKRGHLLSGAALKVTVDAAVDKAEVDAVIDNR